MDADPREARASRRSTPEPGQTAAAAAALRAVADQPAPPGTISRRTGAATGRSGSSSSSSSCRSSPSSSPTTGRSSSPTRARLLFPVFVDYPESKFGGFLATTDYRDPFIQDEIVANGWMVWPPIRYSYRTVNNEIADAGAGAAVVDDDAGGALRALSRGRQRPQLHARQLELARHRRPGPRRGGAADLRLPHLGRCSA